MVLKKSCFIILIVITTFLTGSSQKHITPNQYIATYAPIAIKEMKRTGIPASITLAQGMLESNNGNSKLAKKANNHFGIKCHSDWKGPSVRHDDDKRKECFRKYSSANESFRDHSDFLVEGSRYAFLFNYKPTDYVSWAKGLKKAGYATDRKYAERLINIIEKYELYQYDSGRRNDKKEKRKQKPVESITRDVFINNMTEFVYAKEGDTYKIIADEFQTIENLILKFNDLPKNANITPGQRIYIKPKRNKAEKGNNFHDVKEGETMYTISQTYAIKLKKLYKINNMQPGTKIEPGNRLILR